MKKSIEIYSDFSMPIVPMKIQRVTINVEESDSSVQMQKAIKTYEQKLDEGKQIDFRRRMKSKLDSKNTPSKGISEYRRTS